MEKTELKRKFLAGLFLIAGLLIIVFMILALGQDKGLAQSKFQATVLFKDVQGLGEGAPIRLAGVNVGNVAHIDFLEKEVNGRRVRVIVDIFSRYKRQLERDALKFSIRTEGVLGEKLMEIDVLSPDAVSTGEKVNLSQPIMGDNAIDVSELAEVFARAAESFTKTSEELSKLDMQTLSTSLSDTAQSLSKASNRLDDLLKEMLSISHKTKRLLDRIEQRVIEGTLFKVF